MNIAVLGASGNIGKEITRELAARGHKVTAIARNPEKIPQIAGVAAVAGDASDAQVLAGLIKGSDAVISALHHDVPAETLLTAVKSAGVPRLLVTGGAASLEVAPGVRLFDTPEFPAEWKVFAQRGIDFLTALKGEKGVNWTFLSPAALIHEAPRRGHYRSDTDRLVADDKGHSEIGYADYAIAMVDELEKPRHPRARFTVGY
ncbi:MAG: NAD(P)-dependent oxidoreductase [Paracoccaceae bacterium]